MKSEHGIVRRFAVLFSARSRQAKVTWPSPMARIRWVQVCSTAMKPICPRSFHCGSAAKRCNTQLTVPNNSPSSRVRLAAAEVDVHRGPGQFADRDDLVKKPLDFRAGQRLQRPAVEPAEFLQRMDVRIQRLGRESSQPHLKQDRFS